MISLRYHIVSITAVFLALGLGVALGATFIDRATVETLENRLDDQEVNLEQTQAESEALERRLAAAEATERRLAEEGAARVLAGTLADQPTLLVTLEGTDDALVGRVVDLLEATDADFHGTVRLAQSLVDPAQAATLARVVDADADADDALGILVDELADLLGRATGPAPPPPTTTRPPTTTGAPAPPAPDPTGSAPPAPAATEQPATPPSTSSSTTSTTTTTVPPRDAAVLDDLVDEGFVSVDDPPTPVEPDVVIPPAEAVVVVVLDGSAADGGPAAGLVAEVLEPLLAELADEGPTHVVVAEPGGTALDAAESDVGAGAGLVDTIRSGELALVVSTVSHLDLAAGELALVYALEDVAVDIYGHYGAEEELLVLPPLPARDPDDAAGE